jgi:hypothetical protein
MAMRGNWTYKDLDSLGRVRLSPNFYFREFLHSEIAQFHGVINAPDDIELAIQAGTALCEQVLEPIQAAWGKVHVRSGYRSQQVNEIGNKHRLNCASNARNAAAHIWDCRDDQGYFGATACIVLPGYQNYFERSGDWTSLAWWVHHHISEYYEMCFFKEQCAFNIRWYEGNDNKKSIKTYLTNPETGDKSALLSRGELHKLYQPRSPDELCRRATELLNADRKISG